MTDTKTGPSKTRLVEDAIADLDKIREDVEALTARCERLEEEARGLNGLSGFYTARRKELAVIAGKVEEEAERFRGKMLGEGPKITETVNQDHADRAAEAKAVLDKESAIEDTGS